MTAIGTIARAGRIIDRAAALSGLDQRVILGPRRLREICEVRFAVMRVMQVRGASTSQIGVYLGGRDHSTVIKGLRRAEGMIARDKDFAAFVDKLDRETVA